MRDIRRDLEERIADMELEVERLQKQMTMLTDKAATLKQLLLDEERRWGRSQSPLPGMEAPRKPVGHSRRFKQFLSQTLADGREWRLDDLKAMAAEQGLSPDGKKSLGRILHFALVGMQHSGLAEMVAKGVWKKAEKGGVRQDSKVT